MRKYARVLHRILKIKTFREEFGIAFVIATHDKNVAEICDRILELKNGKLYHIDRID